MWHDQMVHTLKLPRSTHKSHAHRHTMMYPNIPKHAMSIYIEILSMRLWEFLPPANEVCEGYVFTPVCQSFCSQGGSTWAGTPPGQVHPPQAGTPGRYTPLGSCPPPSRSPLQVHPRAGTPWQVHPPGAVHAGIYGQQAGSTHPTGMHSFWMKNFTRKCTAFYSEVKPFLLYMCGYKYNQRNIILIKVVKVLSVCPSVHHTLCRLVVI